MAKKRKTIGLALGGGAARGISHIGVIEILEREHIPVDIITGTSAGAVAGALLASGMTALDIKAYVLGIQRTQWLKLFDFTPSLTGLISGSKFSDEIKRLMGGDLTFSQLKKPFACVACDLDSGEEVVMTRGSVADAVRASISIPGVFSVVKRKGRYLIDGGLVNQVPVNVAQAMGADIVIGVNVVPRRSQKLKQINCEDKAKNGSALGPHPNVFNVMMSTLDIFTSYRVETSLAGADIVIEPNNIGIGPADLNQAPRLILEGELAAIDAIPAIKRELDKPG
jgi:NTE family protein